MTDHELSADGAEVKEPGDRFLTCQPCGRSCQHLGQSQVNTEAMLAVTPYTYVFRSPVKGRWVGSSLLHLMIREFSYVPPATDSVEEGSTEATLDPRISLPAYVDELCDGRLLLHSREAECRCEGQRYRVSLAQSIQRREGGEVMDWPSCKRWIQTLESSTMAQSLVDEEDIVPKRLLLRQKDTLLHTVTRREGRIYAADPIHIMAFEPNGTPLSLMVTSKPSGLPVHPSGSYRRNSVTSILEDIFGGADTSHYTERYHYGDDDCTDELRPDCVPNYVSIVSICKRFELIRVWIRRGEDEGQSGLTMSQWEVLRQMLHRTPAVRETTDDPVRHKRQRRHDDENGSEVAPLKVFVVHRLDAATSGVLLFALNSDSAKSVAAQLAAPEPSDEVSTKEAVPYSSKKTYLAKVTGRVNLRELAESHPNSTTWRVSDVQGDDVLVVQRPIGCLNYHCSLYWCPSATHAAAWAAARRLAPTVAPTSETTSLEVSNSASERLAAKRAHMRERTLGRRPQCIDADNSAASLGEESVEAALQQFEASLRTAMTEVRVRQYCERDNTTLLECRLFTGRTHQLRVHLASLGHPIVGDSKYHDFTTLICQAREKYANTSSTTPLDEVRTFFTDHWKEHVLKREGESGRNCLCPSRIQLHALEYRLPLGSTRRVFRTPIPSWATLTDLSPAVAS